MPLDEVITPAPTPTGGEGNKKSGRRGAKRSPNLALGPAKKRYTSLAIGDHLEERSSEIEGARDARLDGNHDEDDLAADARTGDAVG